VQVGAHDKLGMQLVPLKLLKPYENKEFTLDLLKDTNVNETPNKKFRGQIVVDMTFVPFREDSMKFGGSSEGYVRKDSGIDSVSDDEVQEGAGLLSVVVQEADEVEGHHNNPFAVITFRGEKKRTKVKFLLRYRRGSESTLHNLFIQNQFLSLHKIYIVKKMLAIMLSFVWMIDSAKLVLFNLVERIHSGIYFFADDEENPSTTLE